MEQKSINDRLEALSTAFYAIGILLCMIISTIGIAALTETPSGFILIGIGFVIWLSFYLTSVLLSAFSELLSSTKNIESNIDTLISKQQNKTENEN